MIQRGVDVSYETIRRWIGKFGSQYAKRIKSRCEPPSPVSHLDEVYTKINGKVVYLWRAVDDEGPVLDVGGRKNNRAECSHVPIRRRERKSQRFRSIKGAQKLLSAHSQIYNLFNHRRHIISRNTLRKFRQQAQAEWNLVTVATCA